MRLTSLVYVLSLMLLSNCAAFAAEQSPNVVFVITDDQGYGDLGFTGNPIIKTPHLDKLAEEGTLFTQFYVSGSVCSPSRTAIMTGHFPARYRVSKCHSAAKQMEL